MKRQPQPSDWIILGGGAVMLIASFLAFVKSDFSDDSLSAWSGKGLLFPLSWWPVLFGIAMAVVVALELFAGVNLPQRILSFTWNQIHLVLGLWSTLLMVSWLLVDKGFGKAGIGLFLMLLAAIALLVGAILRTRESPDVTPAGGTYQPPTPF